MKRYVLLLALLTTLDTAQKDPIDGLIHQEGYCVTYGKCTEADGFPCVNNTVALPKNTSETFAENLLKTCPHLSTEDNLCCDGDQVSEFTLN